MKNTIKKTLFTAFISSFVTITIIAMFLIIDDMMHSEVKNFFESLYYLIDYHFVGYDDYYTSGHGIEGIIAIVIGCTSISILIFGLKKD